MATLEDLGKAIKTASRAVAVSTDEQRREALHRGADRLLERAEEVLRANADDVRAATEAGAGETALDRLRLNESRLQSMVTGMRDVAGLPDVIGEVVEGWRRPNGLAIRKLRVPLGVVGVIYENRPNVTSDAAALCIRSGNAAFLRGSSAALGTNIVVAEAVSAGLSSVGLPAEAVTLVRETTRESAVEFMRLRGYIDCLVPRGGHGLITTMVENATVPYVIDGDGNCHVYVDAAADLDMAEAIVVNAKTQRPGVCNAAESLLVHADVSEAFLPRIAAALDGVELVGDDQARALVPSMGVATDDDFATEFLGLKMSVAVVADIEGAIAHVNRYSTGHTEAIVTADIAAADRFVSEVDAAVVAVNASTRFTDGGEFGFGAEIGNSTQKLHARGPMGLRELTCLKYVVTGSGQVRG